MCTLQIVPITQDTRPRMFRSTSVPLSTGQVIEKHYTSGRSAINKRLSVFHTRGIQGRRVRCEETPSGHPVPYLTVINLRSQSSFAIGSFAAPSEPPSRHRRRVRVALRVRLPRPTSCKVAAELFCPRVAASQRGHGNADVDLTTWQTVAESCGFHGEFPGDSLPSDEEYGKLLPGNATQ